MSIADKLTTIAENEQKVYDKGVEDGKQAEYDAFWDWYQMNGTRTDYGAAFGSNNISYNTGRMWTDDVFYPKYNMNCVTVANMFAYSSISNIKQRLIECNVKFTDDSANLYYTFYNAKTAEIPDVSKVAKTNIEHAFRACPNLVSVDGVRFAENCSTSYAFDLSPKLRNITFYGTLGQSINFYTCPLSPESAKSMISCLKNYSGTSNELTYKLTFSSAVWEELEADSVSPTGGTWQEYVYSLGWQC